MVFKLLVNNTPMWKMANEKIWFFFKIFTVRQCNFFLNSNSIWKICSFEVHYVDVAQKIRELAEGS